jgi:hypothetical protein
MTTIIPFLPSNLTRPRFTAAFDGDEYSVELTWNVAAQRYYVTINGLDGSWIVTTPLVTTPPLRRIQSAQYDPFRKVVIVTFVDPTLWPVPLSPGGLNILPGTIVEYTIQNFEPVEYNGTFRCLHINNLSFTYELQNDPGQAVVLGSVGRMMNMVAGVFQTTTFVYRDGVFEISP